MKHASSRELFGYWDRIRGGEPAPARNDIEPSDIRRILADTFILEVVNRESYIVRLAGTRICSIYGREVKGTDFLDLWSGEDRQAVATLATAVSVDAAGALISAALFNARDQSAAGEFLLLPLRHGDGASYDRILGSCATLERPYWLSGAAVVRQEVTGLRLVWPDDRPHFLRRTMDREQASSVIPFPGDRRRRPQLTLLEGGKD